VYNEFCVVHIQTFDVEVLSGAPETLAAFVMVLFSYFYDVATLKVTGYANSTPLPQIFHVS
jgi:hypothetical protein